MPGVVHRFRDPEAVMVWIFQLVCIHSLYMKDKNTKKQRPTPAVLTAKRDHIIAGEYRIAEDVNMVGVTLLADFHWSIGTKDKVTQLVKDAATFCKSSYSSSTALSLLGSIFPADTFWVAFVAHLDASGVRRLHPGGIFRAAACVLENGKADPHWNPFPYRFNRRPFMEYRGKKLGKGKRELGAQKLKSIKGH